MKRFVAVILSVLMISVLSLSCFAADGPAISFEADKTEVKAGDTVIFDMKIENGTGVELLITEIPFAKGLTFVKVEENEELVKDFEYSTRFVFDGIKGDGVIAKLTYSVNADVVKDQELKLDFKALECYNATLDDLTVTKNTVPASVVKVTEGGTVAPATANISFVAEQKEALPGDTIIFDIIAANSTDIECLIFTIVEPEGAVYVEKEDGPCADSFEKHVRCVFEGIKDNGVIGKLIYKVNDDAAEGSIIAIGAVINECYDSDLNDVTVTVIENQFTYVTVLGAACTHAEIELKDAKEATCTEAGYTGDEVCAACEEIVKKGEEIKALGHDYKAVADTAKAATCTEAGKAADEKCSRCGDVKTGAAVAALGHGKTEIKNAKEATNKTEGYTGDTYCTVCGQKIADGQTIPVQSPQTGDNATMWIVITAVSGICLLGALSLKKKEN